MKNKETNESNVIGNDNFNTDKVVEFKLSNIKKLIVFLTGCLGLYVFSLFASFIVVGLPLSKEEMNGVANFIGYGFLFIAILGVVGTDVIKIKKDLRITKFLIGLGFGLAVIFIPMLYDSLINLLMPHGVNNNETALRSFIVIYPVLSIIFLGFIGPFCEEMTYRVGLFGFLSKRKWLAYLVSILVFSLMHFDFMSKDIVTELINLPSYMISAALFAVAYDKFGLQTSLTAHIFNNLYAVIMVIVTAS